MITHEILIEEYEKQLNNKNLGSKPIRMFDENGNFNQNNWNGGDSNLIRNYLDKLDDNTYFHHLEYGFYNINKVYRDDMTYVFITESIVRYNNYEMKEDFINTTYVIGWYKNRGRIDIFTVDGETGTEEEYIDLLNMLEINVEN